jgi:ABC-type antimicrobial peptide transport system ATPase subunit
MGISIQHLHSSFAASSYSQLITDIPIVAQKKKQDQQFGWYKILAINFIAKSSSMIDKKHHGNCLHLTTYRNECLLIMVMSFHLSPEPKSVSASV